MHWYRATCCVEKSPTGKRARWNSINYNSRSFYAQRTMPSKHCQTRGNHLGRKAHLSDFRVFVKGFETLHWFLSWASTLRTNQIVLISGIIHLICSNVYSSSSDVPSNLFLSSAQGSASRFETAGYLPFINSCFSFNKSLKITLEYTSRRREKYREVGGFRLSPCNWYSDQSLHTWGNIWLCTLIIHIFISRCN